MWLEKLGQVLSAILPISKCISNCSNMANIPALCDDAIELEKLLGEKIRELEVMLEEVCYLMLKYVYINIMLISDAL